jgi:hypothetical protein
VLHLARARDLPAWVGEGAVVWEAETRGEIREVASKVIALEARLVRRVGVLDEVTLRLWACGCAERVLPIYERERPGDLRPRQAVEVARRYARGEATLEELDAARDAAVCADRAAAWAASYAASYAAVAAAGDAARDAARAASYAASAAARAATDAAWGAARAAWAAAWDAAWAAAWAAERQWQGERLLAYLRGEVSDG